MLIGFKLKGGDIADEKLAWYRDEFVRFRKQIDTLISGVNLHTLQQRDEPQTKAAAPNEVKVTIEANEENARQAKIKEAAKKLLLAKSLVGKDDVAVKKRFQEIIDKYGDTPSAEQAATILKRMK